MIFPCKKFFRSILMTHFAQQINLKYIPYRLMKLLAIYCAWQNYKSRVHVALSYRSFNCRWFLISHEFLMQMIPIDGVDTMLPLQSWGSLQLQASPSVSYFNIQSKLLPVSAFLENIFNFHFRFTSKQLHHCSVVCEINYRTVWK